MAAACNQCRAARIGAVACRLTASTMPASACWFIAVGCGRTGVTCPKVGSRPCCTPNPINTGYGYPWWLNTGKREWSAAPESSYAAVGAGTSILWIDPANDLVLVARWINQEKVTDVIGHIVDALA